MTTVAVNTYTHSVTYVADNILKSLKDIIRLSGLDPSEFVGDWETHMRGVQTWLNTGDLETRQAGNLRPENRCAHFSVGHRHCL